LNIEFKPLLALFVFLLVCQRVKKDRQANLSVFGFLYIERD